MMPDAMGYGLQHTDARICMVAGGLPIVENGEFLGPSGSAGALSQGHRLLPRGAQGVNFATEFADPLKASSRKLPVAIRGISCTIRSVGFRSLH